MKPVRLTPSLREKVWGATRLSPWFPDSQAKIGEAWFLSPNGTPLPILVKFIFTSDRLSVQVHPDDRYALKHEGTPGKTEMWHILRAEPGATIAVGLRGEISRELLRRAVMSGEVEDLLNWVPVAPGDTFFTPPGTIHAIGAGIALCEIQQQSDITYRLYDYGRPRQLHLERAIAVSKPVPHPGKSVPVVLSGTEQRLAECPYFVTDRIEVSSTRGFAPEGKRDEMLIVLDGEGTLAGLPYRSGEAWLAAAGTPEFTIDPRQKSCFLRTYVP